MGIYQNGFKRQKSTSTLALQLQSLKGRALDLCAAFGIDNTDLHLKQLRILGLPVDIVGLIETWLRNRLFYEQVKDLNSNFTEINLRTIQGSILGPILYAILVAPLYYISKLSHFANSNFALFQIISKLACVNSMETKLKLILE